MGWFGRLGNAIVGGVQKLGHAAHQGIDSAVRLVDKVAPKVEAIASKPFTAEIRIVHVGEVVGSIAAESRPRRGEGCKKGCPIC